MGKWEIMNRLELQQKLGDNRNFSKSLRLRLERLLEDPGDLK